LIGDSNKVPNTQGFEYYTGGVFEMTRTDVSPKSVSASNLPNSFDWRDRHGRNWSTSVKNQGNCGSCWALCTVGAIESTINLYFNDPNLDLDLSEQEIVSCGPIFGSLGCIAGGNIEVALNYFHDNGLSDESCFPYQAQSLSCDQKCTEPKNRLTTQGSDKVFFFPSDEEIKLALIQNGPLAAHIFNLMHGMTLVGYTTDPENPNNTIWIFKNSYGTAWGEYGYSRFKSITFRSVTGIGVPLTLSNNPNLKISCIDKDNDGYCNWGISEKKPTTCPASCRTEKDCDDSDPNLGPFDSSFNCSIIGSDTISDTEPPQVQYLHYSLLGGKTCSVNASVYDNGKLLGCTLIADHVPGNQHYESPPMSIRPSPSLLDDGKNDVQIYYTFINSGKYNIRVKCWDEAGNIGLGEVKEITLESNDEPSPTPSTSDPSVGKISPVVARINTTERFSALVSDDQKVVSCALKVNGEAVEYMQLSKSPCSDCSASVDYKFTSRGKYSLLARCADNEGNVVEGEPILINIGTNCPDCNALHTDLCETPPRCEKDCDASPECDEKERNYSWISGNNCNGCSNSCIYNLDSVKPVNSYQLNQNICYYNCSASCNSHGWGVSYAPSKCKTETCPKTKVAGNICYYLRSCGTSGCRYLNTDTNRLCDDSACTESGWNNSACQNPTPADNWKPCNPSPSWVCGESNGGSSPFCEGTHIGWGWGDDGEIICPTGTIVTKGLCKGKNDDSIQKQEIRVNMVPSPASFSDTTTFVPQSSWYCKFKCSKLFCGADGCAWAKCEAGSQSIDKIELKIYNLAGSLVFDKTTSNQGEVVWDGKNNVGKQLANGLYGYQAKVYLKNGKNYTTQEKIQILR